MVKTSPDSCSSADLISGCSWLASTGATLCFSLTLAATPWRTSMLTIKGRAVGSSDRKQPKNDKMATMNILVLQKDALDSYNAHSLHFYILLLIRLLPLSHEIVDTN